jgi:essential nuclear protein 1
MPKDKDTKKRGSALKHAPLGSDLEKPSGKLSAPKVTYGNMEEDAENEDAILSPKLSSAILSVAKEQRMEDQDMIRGKAAPVRGADSSDDESIEAAESDSEDGEFEELVEIDGADVHGADITEAEEALIEKFLHSETKDIRTLADIIMDKINDKSTNMPIDDNASQGNATIPPKVIEVYTSVGAMLHNYKSGKIPKALKMLPHLKNWEDIMWLTRPDQWSPCATYVCTRIFASNLHVNMAQRFYNLVLLEKCRDDIQINKTLNYHLYMALKKALFKPAAFYKGILLPLAQSQTCTLREATIIGSVMAKASIPANHSAAALIRLAEMPYSGSTSLFIRILLMKKYALPLRVIDAMVDHFTSFEEETRALPVRTLFSAQKMFLGLL